MIKAQAWPYPVFERVECNPLTAIYNGMQLKIKSTARGWIIVGNALKDRSTGIIDVTIQITTPVSKVSCAVFDVMQEDLVRCGVRVLCKESKFRSFTLANDKQTAIVKLPLERLRGYAEVLPVFICANPGTASNGVDVQKGALIGVPTEPIFLTIDEDWAGETIPVDWLNFEEHGLPAEALTDIEFFGGGQVPNVWLNSKYKSYLEHVLLRKGDSSPAGLAGAAMREFFWVQVWEKVIIWALKEESQENSDWPSTRIANYWRAQFEEQGWELPNANELDAGILNELSFRIQHCLTMAQRVSRIHGILRFQPENTGSV